MAGGLPHVSVLQSHSTGRGERREEPRATRCLKRQDQQGGVHERGCFGREIDRVNDEMPRIQEEPTRRARILDHALEESGPQRPDAGEKHCENAKVRRERPPSVPVGDEDESLLPDLRVRPMSEDPRRRLEGPTRNHESLARYPANPNDDVPRQPLLECHCALRG